MTTKKLKKLVTAKNRPSLAGRNIRASLNRAGDAWKRFFDLLNTTYTTTALDEMGHPIMQANGEMSTRTSTPKQDIAAVTAGVGLPVSAATIGIPATVGSIAMGSAGDYVGNKIGRGAANLMGLNENAQEMFGNVGGFLGFIPGSKVGAKTGQWLGENPFLGVTKSVPMNYDRVTTHSKPTWFSRGFRGRNMVTGGSYESTAFVGDGDVLKIARRSFAGRNNSNNGYFPFESLKREHLQRNDILGMKPLEYKGWTFNKDTYRMEPVFRQERVLPLSTLLRRRFMNGEIERASQDLAWATQQDMQRRGMDAIDFHSGNLGLDLKTGLVVNLDVVATRPRSEGLGAINDHTNYSWPERMLLRLKGERLPESSEFTPFTPHPVSSEPMIFTNNSHVSLQLIQPKHNSLPVEALVAGVGRSTINRYKEGILNGAVVPGPISPDRLDSNNGLLTMLAADLAVKDKLGLQKQGVEPYDWGSIQSAEVVPASSSNHRELFRVGSSTDARVRQAVANAVKQNEAAVPLMIRPEKATEWKSSHSSSGGMGTSTFNRIMNSKF